MGQKLTGDATALIIAAVEAEAEYYALHDLAGWPLPTNEGDERWMWLSPKSGERVWDLLFSMRADSRAEGGTTMNQWTLSRVVPLNR